MILMTMIARVADGLPLAASIQEDEQVKRQKYDILNKFSIMFQSFIILIMNLN
jgi:vesicle transport protein SEC22